MSTIYIKNIVKTINLYIYSFKNNNNNKSTCNLKLNSLFLFFISITCDGQSNLNRIDDTSKNEHTSAHYIKFEIY
jgi:hypothetical protein